MAQRNFHEEFFDVEQEERMCAEPEYFVDFFHLNPDGKSYTKIRLEYYTEESAERRALEKVDELKEAIVTNLYDDTYIKRCGFIPKRKDVI